MKKKYLSMLILRLFVRGANYVKSETPSVLSNSLFHQQVSFLHFCTVQDSDKHFIVIPKKSIVFFDFLCEKMYLKHFFSCNLKTFFDNMEFAQELPVPGSPVKIIIIICVNVSCTHVTVL